MKLQQEWHIRLEEVLVIGLLLVILPLSHCEGNEYDSRKSIEESMKSGLWRRPENDGLNCLYLQLTTMGYPEQYEEFLGRFPTRPTPGRLDELAAVSRTLRYDLVPARLTQAELTSLETPITGYFERQDRGSGYFALIVRDNGRDVILVDGGSVIPTPMPQDTFRREWSGYALVPAHDVGWSSSIRTALASLIAAWAICSLLSRFFQRKRGKP